MIWIIGLLELIVNNKIILTNGLFEYTVQQNSMNSE